MIALGVYDLSLVVLKYPGIEYNIILPLFMCIIYFICSLPNIEEEFIDLLSPFNEQDNFDLISTVTGFNELELEHHSSFDFSENQNLQVIVNKPKSPRHFLKRSRQSYNSDDCSSNSSEIDYPTIYDKEDQRSISDTDSGTDGSESEGERNENYLEDYFNRKFMKVQRILSFSKGNIKNGIY